MQLTKRSQLSGKENTMDLPISPDALVTWQNGSLHIQDAFPGLSADQREFILTGITPEEWQETFGSGDDE